MTGKVIQTFSAFLELQKFLDNICFLEQIYHKYKYKNKYITYTIPVRNSCKLPGCETCWTLPILVYSLLIYSSSTGIDILQKTVFGVPEPRGIPSPYEDRVISQGAKFAGPCQYCLFPSDLFLFDRREFQRFQGLQNPFQLHDVRKNHDNPSENYARLSVQKLDIRKSCL